MKNKAVACLVLLTAAALYRVLPHPPNFAPLGAIAFLGGIALGPRAGIAITLGALLLSDLWLNVMLTGSAFYAARIVDYAAFAAIAGGAGFLRRSGRGTRLAGAVATPFVFFLISNFGVWLFGIGLDGQPYARTAGGLVSCYVTALPFLGHAALGDWFFMGLLLGCCALVSAAWAQTARTPLPAR